MKREEALKILERENIDLDEFETSEEYCYMIWNTITDSIYKDLKGFQVSIDGDVTHIIMSDRDEMKLRVVYSIRPDILLNAQDATIIIKDETYKKWIRENLKPNTRMKFYAKYNGSAHCFDLVSIIDTSLEMKFGHYICSECGYDYGRKVDSKYCCICEGTIKYVDNFYEDEKE